MAWTERYVDAASSGGDGTTNATSGANAAWATLAAAITGVGAGPASVATRINVKAGTYSQSSTSLTFNTAGATTAPVWWRGYKATIGDQDTNNVAVAGTDIPSVTFSTGQFIITGAQQIFSNFDVSGANVTAGGQIYVSTGTDVTIYRCRATATAANANSRAMTFGSSSVNCVAVACYMTATSSALCSSGSGTGNRFLGCTFAGGLGGLSFGSASASYDAIFCVFDLTAGDALTLAGAACNVINCSIYGKATGGGNGINITSVPVAGHVIANCYFENVATAAKYAINNTSGANTNRIRLIGNAYYGCTGTVNGLGDSPLIFDNGVLASSAFTAPASHNFSIGTVARAIGYPGTFENTSVYQGYLDLGAVQRQEAGAGGGAIFPNFNGGFDG